MSTIPPELISSKLPEFFLASSGEFVELPAWCRFYLQLGARVRLDRIPGARSVVALSIPTKTFAAPLVAAGASLAAILALPFTDADMRAHLEFLRNLPLGTPLSYRHPRSNNVERCLYDGCDDSGLTVRVKVADNGKLTRSLPLDLAFGLARMGDESYRLKYNRKGRSMVDDDKYQFLRSLLGKQKAGELLAYSRVESIVIGFTNRFREEISAMLVGVQKPTPKVAPLGILLGVPNLASTNIALRTLAIPVTEDPRSTGYCDPAVTILNGSNAVLDHYGSYPCSNCVAILDRTDPHFTDAANRIKDAYYKRLNLPDRVEPQDPPAAIEQLWFAEPFL